MADLAKIVRFTFICDLNSTFLESIMSIHGIIYGIKTFSRQLDGDQADQMNYFVTSNLLLVLSGLSGYKAFAADPLDCLVPMRFPSSWQTVDFC